MINNIFKSLYLIVLILAVIILFGIYKKSDSGRFVDGGNGTVIDTQTGYKYAWQENQGFIVLDKKGKFTNVKDMPFE